MANQGAPFRRNLDDDGLSTPCVGRWALKKYEVHARYARMFSTGMKEIWPQRCYVGLCTGPGRARIRSSGEVVETSAMTALRLPDPFTKYIFCDEDEAALDDLRQRASSVGRNPKIAWVLGDANERVDEILGYMPRYSSDNRLLSLCFLDPYATNIRFETIRELASRYIMDFLMVLPLGMDARRNLRRYMEPGRTRIDEFLGDPDWRHKLDAARARGENSIHFLARRFSEQMTALGYQETAPREMMPIRSTKKNLNLYLVGLFTGDERGKDLWRKAISGAGTQQSLGL